MADFEFYASQLERAMRLEGIFFLSNSLVCDADLLPSITA